MSKNKANNTMTNHSAGLVPKLRFPEFRGEWEVYRIGDIGEFINGLNGKSSSDFGMGSPFITYKQVFDHSTINFSECGRVRINENQNTIRYGDILFTTSSETREEVGFSSVVLDEPNEPTYLNSFCFAIRPHKDFKIRPDFSRYLFHSPFYRKNVIRIAQGSTRYNISKSTFQEIKIPLPLLSEQQKIAACLSSLDELITAEGQKLELLKEHKKGLLQNLFPQEGEKVPRLRFKEFEKDGEWVEKRLGQLGQFAGGGTPSKTNESFWSGNIPWVSSSDLDEDSIFLIKVSRFISEEALKNSAAKLVPANSILLVSRVGVGKLAITKSAICTSQDFTNFTPNNHDLIFLAYYLKTRKERLLGFSQGMAIKGFTKDDVMNLRVYLPTLTEQQKIAFTLSSLDDLIQAQSQRIEALQVHKKGLLQGLFPDVSYIQ